MSLSVAQKKKDAQNISKQCLTAHSYRNSIIIIIKHFWVFGVLMYTVIYVFYNPLQSKIRIRKGDLHLVWVILYLL